MLKKGPGEAKRPPGRPPKLTPELIETIQNGIMLGNYLSVVAASCGVHRDAIYEWLKRGNRDRTAGLDNLYTRFADATKKAMAIAEMDAVQTIRQAGSVGIWQARAWWLERFHHNRWSHKERMDMTVRQKSDVEDMTPEEREELIDKLVAKRGTERAPLDIDGVE